MLTKLEPDEHIVDVDKLWLTAEIPLLTTVIATGLEYEVHALTVAFTR